MLETREGGCHCGQVRFRAEVDLDLLSSCSCSICTKKGILHLGTDPATFQLLCGKTAPAQPHHQRGAADRPGDLRHHQQAATNDRGGVKASRAG